MRLFDGKQFIVSILVVPRRHCPDFNLLPGSIPDHRKKKTYQVAEIIMAGLHIFIFKRGSRNSADNGIPGSFEDNYIKLFGLRPPIMDTVHIFLKDLPPGELEKLEQVLVQRLVEKKVPSKYRFNNRYVVGVDATGMFSFGREPFPGCPHRTSKNGKTTWQAYVLEAKILCGNGFSISLSTEWARNSEDLGEKRDCELKAFARLAEKIKKTYPRLPIIIAADSLYPNKTVFNICKLNNWPFILTFKDGTLKSAWGEVYSRYPLDEGRNKAGRVLRRDGHGWLHEEAMFLGNLEYGEFKLNWVECTKSYAGREGHEARFVHITDMEISKGNAFDVSRNGRLRWKIENEGFNAQKNGGYKLQHKYSEKNLFAMQNYYQLLQIAHLIVQLTEKLKKVKEGLAKSGRTIISIWEDMNAAMLKETFIAEDLEMAVRGTKQLRY